MAKLNREEQLQKEIRETFQRLIDMVAAFSQEQFSRVPYPGSWTPGQVSDHIIRFSANLPDSHVEPANRRDDEQVAPITALFRNYAIKMSSPDFIVPDDQPRKIRDDLATFTDIRTTLETKVMTTDLSVICLDLEVPVFGYLTRYEWLKFIVVHVERHIHQLDNMLIGFSIQPSE